jgi:hypothetical protein
MPSEQEALSTPMAGVDLVAEHLSEIPGRPAENILNQSVKPLFSRILDRRLRVSPNSCETQEM